MSDTFAFVPPSLSQSLEHLLVAKVRLPEIGRIRLRDTELVSGEDTVRKQRLQLTQHVTKH